MSQIELGVRLLNEGTDVWVMVPAQEIMANICVILDNNIEEEQGCQLEFKPGSLVMVVDHKNAEGFEYPVAMRLYGGIMP
jgi:hypothetical protein